MESGDWVDAKGACGASSWPEPCDYRFGCESVGDGGPEGAIKKLEMNRLQQCVVSCACLVNTAGGWMVTKVAYDQYLQSEDVGERDCAEGGQCTEKERERRLR